MTGRRILRVIPSQDPEWLYLPQPLIKYNYLFSFISVIFMVLNVFRSVNIVTHNHTTHNTCVVTDTQGIDVNILEINVVK